MQKEDTYYMNLEYDKKSGIVKHLTKLRKTETSI